MNEHMSKVMVEHLDGLKCHQRSSLFSLGPLECLWQNTPVNSTVVPIIWLNTFYNDAKRLFYVYKHRTFGYKFVFFSLQVNCKLLKQQEICFQYFKQHL